MSVHSLELTKSGIVGALTFKSVPLLMDFLEAYPNHRLTVYFHLPPFASQPSAKLAEVIPVVEKRLGLERARANTRGWAYDANRQDALRQLHNAMCEYDRRKSA